MKKVMLSRVILAIGMMLVWCIYGVTLFVASSNCSAASYPRFTTTPLTTDLSMNQYKLTDVGDIITKGPWVDVRAYASINAAVTAIGTAETTLLVPNAQTLTASLIIPPTLTLKILKGGSIVKASTYTLTVNGPFESGLYKVFSGFSSGDVTFGSGSIKEVYAEWWWSDSESAYTAIVAAYNSITTGRLSLLSRTYDYGTTLNFAKPGIDVIGVAKGRNKAESGTGGGTVLNFTGTGVGVYIGWNQDNIYDGTKFVYDATFANFRVKTGTTNCNIGMRVRYSHDLIVHDITVEEGDAAGQYPTNIAFLVDGAVSNHFYDIHVNGSGSGGNARGIVLSAIAGANYSVDPNPGGLALTSSKFDRIRSRVWAMDGMQVGGDVQGCQFNSVNLESNGRYGLKIDDVDKVNTYNNFWFENNTQYDIAFFSSVLTNKYQNFKNTFFNCPASRSRYVLLAGVDNIVFDGNQYLDPNANGFADHGASIGKVTILNDDKYWSGYVYPATVIKPDKRKMELSWSMPVDGGWTGATFTRVKGAGSRYYTLANGWIDSFVSYSNNAPGVGKSYVIALRVNGSEVITQSIDGTALHTETIIPVDQVRFAAGDYITATITSTSGTPAANDVYVDAVIAFVK